MKTEDMVPKSNTLIDNSDGLKMVDILKGCISESTCTVIKIATGYWDIPGLSLVRNELKAFLQRNGTELQLLIGTDPVVRASQVNDPKYKGQKFPEDFIKVDFRNLDVKPEYSEAVKLLLDYCGSEEKNSKIKIRIFRKNDDGDAQFLHAKCYIFLGEERTCGIVGSSNFTQKGLVYNAELNHYESNSSVVMSNLGEFNKQKGHNLWFDEKWEVSKPWNGQFLECVLKPSPNAKKVIEEQNEGPLPLTPYELYIKLMQTKFGDIVDHNLSGIIESYLPQHYLKLDYQLDAVKQCFSIMKEHGGFMLADVVGLGKTIVGMLIIKHFLQFPDEDGRDRLVLIVTPPAIKSAWVDTIAEFDADSDDKIAGRIDFITTGSIGKLVDNLGDELEDDEDDADSGDFEEGLKSKNYGLIIIDESHKFRNSGTSMYKALDDLISQIGTEVGAYPYVGLLSATPQNNRPDDLKNQIYLFERNRSDSTLRKAKGGNIEGFFSEMGKRYAQIINSSHSVNESEEFDRKLSPKEIDKELNDISASIRNCVLSDILVRRTRTDVQKYYQNDMGEQKMRFPKISGPNSLQYLMKPNLARLFSQTMNLIAQRVNETSPNHDFLGYYRYRLIEFILDPEIKQVYKGRNLEPDRFSQQLARIMQVNLVKRLESSFSAFRTSLNNLRCYTQNMIDMWEKNAIFICPQIDVNGELNVRKHWEQTHRVVSFDSCIEDIRRKIKKLNEDGNNIKERNREFTRAEFSEQYINLLRQDLAFIDDLCEQWKDYPEDPKLDVFKHDLRPVLFDKQKNPSQLLVIFTEAIDTVRALVTVAENQDFRVLSITAKNRKDKELEIKENFDANYRGEKKFNYDIIITTEVLAEGVNLHRANTILNYDTPWNSTRLMQRIGRVNRIGSDAEYVYVYNFMPSSEGDAEINLVKKAHAKLQSFHTLFGEDSKIYSQDEEVAHYDLNAQVNGEESPLEKYVYELREYKTANPERYHFIEECQNDLFQAVNLVPGGFFFLVRTPKISGMFVQVVNDKASILSTDDMLHSCCSTPDVQSVPLPSDWDRMKDLAVLCVNQELTRLPIHVGNNKRAIKAKEFILRIKDRPGISKESRTILERAFKLIRQGNNDIIRRVIMIEEQLKKEESENIMFPTTQSDIDSIIGKDLEKIVSNARETFGIAEAYIGIAK